DLLAVEQGRLSGGDLPQHGASAGHGQEATVRAEHHAVGHPPIDVEDGPDLPGGDAPQRYGAVAVAGRQEAAVRAERDGEDVAWAAGEGPAGPAGGPVPQPYRRIPPARGEHPTVRAERQAPHITAGIEGGGRPTGGEVPQPYLRAAPAVRFSRGEGS